MFEPWHGVLIDELRVARLATIARDGRPHLVPVCYAFVDERFAIAIDEKPKRSTRLARVANIERDSRVSLLLDRYEDDWTHLAWVRVDGDARILARGDGWPEALDALRSRYPQYRAMDLEALPLVVIEPSHVAAWSWNPPSGA